MTNMAYVLYVPTLLKKARMDKCKHGFSHCSECGMAAGNPDAVSDEQKESFNNFCADVLGYRPSYRNRVHIWLSDNKEVIDFNPYQNHEQLIPVIEQMMKRKTTCQD